MPDEIAHLLKTARTVAVVGLSPKPDRPSYGVAAHLIEQGFTVFPVNPLHAGQEILGRRVHASLADIPEPIDIVDVFRRADQTPDVARAAVAAGARALWLQLGIVNEDAARIARAGGLQVVMDRCMKMELDRVRNAT